MPDGVPLGNRSAEAARDDVTVRILLSTFNGAPFLREQLESLRRQTHRAWVLVWRDDGSSDGSERALSRFAREVAQPVVRLREPHGHLGATESFMTLLRAALACAAPADVLAFADQDDVWLADKLARGVAALTGTDPARPALYCARQVIVDGTLRRLRVSAHPTGPVGFPAALAQNIATGCTIILNSPAARLIAASTAPEGALHDWWCYLVVAAAGGAVLTDDHPTVLYRQHGRNMVGAPTSFWRRARAVARRGPGPFMATLRCHIAGLQDQPFLLDRAARESLDRISRALQDGPPARLAALRSHGFRRQTWLETLVFRLWFLLG